MIFFRKKASSPSSQEDTHPEVKAGVPTLAEEDPIWDEPGPRSAHEVDSSVGFIDMGSLRIPAVPGMQVQTEISDDKKSVIRVLLVMGTSGVQIAVAAAPRSGGVWDDVRDQIVAGLESEGASVELTSSRYGTEILATAEVATPDGNRATSHMRILGREGDRWFARINVLGPAAIDRAAAVDVEKVIDRIVVVRDDKPRARLDPLPVSLPQGAVELPGA